MQGEKRRKEKRKRVIGGRGVDAGFAMPLD